MNPATSKPEHPLALATRLGIESAYGDPEDES